VTRDYHQAMTHKTNAVRLLDQMGVHYELREYEVDPEDLAAEAVAAKIGLPPGSFSKRWSPRATGTASAWPRFRATQSWT
jgi:hypothetical protein